MIVYSVLVFVDYEGSELLGVFGDRESALAFARSQPAHQRHWAGYCLGVVACELGQPLDVLGTVEYVD
jgi:hypothetical protein